MQTHISQAPARRRLLHLALGLVFSSLASAAVASDFSAVIYNVPDNDQRRDYLPGNGSMYCAPTSAYNLIHYMWRHGAPSLKKMPLLDPGNFIIDQDAYKGHDLRIAMMGQLMDTSATGGTTGGDFTEGMADYIDMVSNVNIVVIGISKDDGFPSPKFAWAWMVIGGLVDFCYGRYTNINGYHKTRDGGHCVTMNRVEHDSGGYTIGYRNPWTDEGEDYFGQLVKQATWASDVRDLHAYTADFDGTETQLFGIGSKPTEITSKSRYAYLDGYHLIVPGFYMTNVKKTVTADGSRVDHFHMMSSMAFDPASGMYTEERMGDRELPSIVDLSGDFTPDPVLPSFVRTMQDSKRIYQTDYVGNETRVLASAPERPIALEYGGRLNSLFVLQPNAISLLGRDNRWLANAPLDFGPEAEAYDAFHQEVAVAGGRTIQILSATLDPTSQSFVEGLSGSGKLTLRFDPRSHDLFAMRTGVPAVQRFHRGRSGYAFVASIPLSGLTRPDSFDFDRRGMLFASDNGRLHQFLPNGRPSKGSQFDNGPSGDVVKFAKNFSNYDATAYPFPAWRNLDHPGGTLR